MPTTLPSPADRGEFRFAAVDAAGREWRWIDDETVWACVGPGIRVERHSRHPALTPRGADPVAETRPRPRA